MVTLFVVLTHMTSGLAISHRSAKFEFRNTCVFFNRTATVGIGLLHSDTFQSIPKGTPQGSVISPLLFNIGMKDIPPLLTTILKLPHALYA